MAKGNQGILGNLSGSVGNVVASSWKGIGVFKSKPSSVANPQTAAQVAQRSAMSATVAFAKIILGIWIKPIFDRFAQKMTGYNLWVQKNIGFFADPENVDYTSLIMSVGNMTATPFVSPTLGNGEDTLTLEWTPDTEGFHLATDICFALAYNQTTGEVASSSTQARSTGTCDIIFTGAITTGDPINIWMVFKRSNGVYVSLAYSDEITVTA
ncbi:MAG: hypothetical protein RLY43_1289 [Bacteroidota bacterium]|jgi:hypothetical protein